MFDFGKNVLLKRIEELELLLERQKRENADRETELKRFHEQEQFQQRSFQEIKLAMEARLKELDGRIQELRKEKEQEELRMEAEKKQMRQRLKEEEESARNALKREIEEEKKRASDHGCVHCPGPALRISAAFYLFSHGRNAGAGAWART